MSSHMTRKVQLVACEVPPLCWSYAIETIRGTARCQTPLRRYPCQCATAMSETSAGLLLTPQFPQSSSAHPAGPCSSSGIASGTILAPQQYSASYGVVLVALQPRGGVPPAGVPPATDSATVQVAQAWSACTAWPNYDNWYHGIAYINSQLGCALLRAGHCLLRAEAWAPHLLIHPCIHAKIHEGMASCTSAVLLVQSSLACLCICI